MGPRSFVSRSRDHSESAHDGLVDGNSDGKGYGQSEKWQICIFGDKSMGGVKAP